MKKVFNALAVVLALGLAASDADAAKRFGGGGNLGKQRPAPTAKEAPKEASAAAPASSAAAKPAQPAPATPATPPAPQPSFMSRWGGMLVGLGIGALLASMFGAQIGPIVGLILAALLAVGFAYLVFRLFAARNRPAAKPLQLVGIGGAAQSEVAARTGEFASAAWAAPQALAESEIAPFLRVAKTSFIRLQAANDAGDLDDIRDYTTPEMYAELAMQIHDRGGAPQKVEVLALDAQLVEAVVEGNHAIASVHFSGLIREAANANPEPFDEVWHVRKDLRERDGGWLIAGIQQSAAAA